MVTQNLQTREKQKKSAHKSDYQEVLPNEQKQHYHSTMSGAKIQKQRHEHPLSMNGVFAIEKPAGLSSSRVMSQIQQVFNTSQVFAYDLEKTGKYISSILKQASHLQAQTSNLQKKRLIVARSN